MNALCLFCDSAFADILETASISRVVHLFPGVKLNQLEGKKACSRCYLNLNLIENTLKLKEDMHTALAARLSQHQLMNGVSSFTQNDFQPILPHHQQLLDNQSVIPTEQSKRDSKELGYAGDLQLSSLGSSHDSKAKSQPEPLKPPTIGRKRIHNCYKCNISLKTRTFTDGLRHVQRCTGQGIRKGRTSLAPRPDMYPCMRCGRKLATREAFQIHVRKCDGTGSQNRGRKPADNICMLCNEDLVYRHILKKHLRVKHGINAQRLDDSVLAALRTGIGPGIVSKENVLSQIKQKLRSAATSSSKVEASNDNLHADNTEKHSDTQQNTDQTTGQEAEEDSEELDTVKPFVDQSANHNHATRSRKNIRPTRYVAAAAVADEVFTCDMCNKQFAYKSQYEQHCCFLIQSNSNDENSPVSNSNPVNSGDTNSTDVLDGIEGFA